MFRRVDSGLGGGGDAWNYAFYFENCLGEMPAYYSHFDDLLYAVINRFIRLFVSDYHIYFLILYGFMFFTIICFVDYFAIEKSNAVPYILIIYFYLRGYQTIRTNLGICFIVFSFVFLHKGKWGKAIITAFASVLCHKSCALYFLFIPFIYICEKSKVILKNGIIPIKTTMVFTIISALISDIGRDVFLYITKNIDLGGYYQSYAKMNENVSFFDNFWKIVFEQLLLAAVLIVFQKAVKKRIASLPENKSTKLKLIWNICAFDFMMIPITFTFNIWRVYEFLYIPRLVMWSEILTCINNRFSLKSRRIRNICYIAAFSIWFIFRLYSIYYDGMIMPYVIGFTVI